MVICSCDLVGIYENLLAAVRKELGSFEGLDAEKVMIGATHTHTSMKYKMKKKRKRRRFAGYFKTFAAGELNLFAVGDRGRRRDGR